MCGSLEQGKERMERRKPEGAEQAVVLKFLFVFVAES